MTMNTIPISAVKIKHLKIKLIGYYSQPPLCPQVAQRLDVEIDTTNYRWNTESPFPRKALPCRSFRKENISRNSTLMPGMDGEAIFFTWRGGAGRGKAKILRGREPPLPHNAGRGGEGVKICGAGRSSGGEQLIEIICCSKEMLICIK